MFKKKDLKKTVENAQHFETDITVGLTTVQVNKRVEEGLVNKVKKHVTKSYFRIFYENIVNFFNLLLFFIAAVMIVAKISISSYAFLVILIANIVIGLYQDIRARKLIDKLKVVSTPKVRVLRNGRVKSISAKDVVYDDLIEITQGTQIVCDGSLVDGFVEMNESLLTGEPNNIIKSKGEPIYSGSFVTSGTGLYRVEQLGKNNYAEKLQNKAKKFKRTKSEILINIKRIFRVIGIIVVSLAIVEVIVQRESLIWPTSDMATSPFHDAIAKISASLIAMIPTGMYLLTSVTLAVGAIRLAAKNMLTQDMYCIEMLARVDTLCLDKTGTLTDGKLSVDKVVSTSITSEKDLAKLLITIVEATKDGNPTATAIREAYSSLNKYDTFSAIPFNSERKYSAAMLQDGRTIILGAREFIPHPDKLVDSMAQLYESKGLRVLVIGVQTHVINIEEPLEECEIIGFVVLKDHIRDDAPENIRWFKENGVNIRIITGDNPLSASEIARRAGIDGYEKQISLEGMTTEEVRRIARDYVIFGRVTPEQKEVLVQTFKDQGHTVAMTGDGVNDILALRVADCSIAMASGADAAKNVSHLVSLDSNFSTMPEVVREGRRVINNLQRSISIFLIKTVFAMLTSVICIIWGLIDKRIEPSYPFETNNLYIWEILFIGIGSLFLSLQPNDEKVHSNFLANILFKVVPAAVVQVGLVIFFKAVGIDNAELAKTYATIAISIFSFVILVRVCMPFDVYRLFLVVGLGFIGGVAVLADYFALGDNSVLGLTYSLLSGDFTKTFLIAMGVAIVIYIVLEIISSKLHKYLDKRNEERKYENF